ncbi:hypothetical protein DRI50_03535 [candidate division KSB1 bacterium]|nr:MAG: hypothetical protein DRI50_03535 [candidate division KSB1 bacterium]
MKRLLIISLFGLLLFSCVNKVTKTNAPKETPQKPAYSVWTTAYVLKDHVLLRKGPGKKFPTVTTLQDGDQVRIIRNKHGWYKVVTDKNKSGWIRSNFVGPRNLSRTVMAAAFNDSIMNHFDAKLYIDKNHPYQVIYLETTEKNIGKAKKIARTIGKAYQQKVYPGKVTINLIRPHQTKYFTQVVLKPRGLAKIPVPIIEYGYLEKLIVKGKTVRLQVRVPNGLSRKALLTLARKISSAYAYPFTKSEVLVRPMGASKKCLLYFLEDKYGEDYTFGKCALK